MSRILAYLLTTLMLLQTFGRELVVLEYQVHKARITQLFCVNKSRPRLQCNGRCHLKKKLRQAAGSESKAPFAGWAKVRYEALLPARPFFAAPAAGPAGRAAPGPFVVPQYSFAPAHGIFHPPAFGA